MCIWQSDISDILRGIDCTIKAPSSHSSGERELIKRVNKGRFSWKFFKKPTKWSSSIDHLIVRRGSRG